jgi:hypothetical protein
MLLGGKGTHKQLHGFSFLLNGSLSNDKSIRTRMVPCVHIPLTYLVLKNRQGTESVPVFSVSHQIFEYEQPFLSMFLGLVPKHFE